MEINLSPRQELIDRALATNFRKIEGTPCLMGMSSTIALLTGEMFNPIHYLGTATILSHKLKPFQKYAVTNRGPIYTGDLLKVAIRILGSKRVRFFFHYKSQKEKSEFCILLLGTKDGIIAIAPQVPDKDYITIEEIGDVILLTDYLRGGTTRFKRGVIFESI